MSSRDQIRFLVVLAFLALAGACGGETKAKYDDGGTLDSPPAGTGGRSASGGASGRSATGGSLGTGGQGTGGAFGTGGRGATGGGAGSGGAFATGGGVGSGGVSTTGGSVGTGGVTRLDGGFGTGGTGAGGGGAGGGTVYDARRDLEPADAPTDLIRPEAGAEVIVQDARPDLPGPDASADIAGPDAPADLPMPADTVAETVAVDESASPSLDDCFAGLPAPEGIQMVATKSTADGRVRIRIALDTENRFGTSGTMPWAMIRLGVEVDGVVTCITSPGSLSYSIQHHNCDDTAAATAGTTRYDLAAPDRTTAVLTIVNGGATAGPYTLTDTTCAMAQPIGPFAKCASGGPCS